MGGNSGRCEIPRSAGIENFLASVRSGPFSKILKNFLSPAQGAAAQGEAVAQNGPNGLRMAFDRTSPDTIDLSPEIYPGGRGQV
jgi:hypothetical protein